MKAISWNVNGFRAVLNKGFLDYLADEKPDIIGLQEVKATIDKIPPEALEAISNMGYHISWHAAERPGYSGTAIFSLQEPLRVIEGFEGVETGDNPILADDTEGRVLTLEFPDYFFTTVYTPNAKDDLSRLDLRYSHWDMTYRAFLEHLASQKSVMSCGDFNVAHEEIDLARPKPNVGKKGFTDEERERFGDFIAAGFIDTYRYLNPETHDGYSWWSYMGGARSRNVGWRIDYFLISPDLKSHLTDAFIRSEVMGSDHCPVGIILDI